MGGRKGATAKEKKAAKAANQKAADEAAAEDAYWSAMGDGKKSKAQQRKANKQAGKHEAAARKAEAKRMAQEEETAMAKFGKKEQKQGSSKKVTQAELTRMKEKEAVQKQREQEKRQKAARREMDEGAYARLVDVENTNAAADVVDARDVDGAIKGLETMGFNTDLASPQRKVSKKTLHATFKLRMLADLKADKPGLTNAQYNDMVHKMWQREKKRLDEVGDLPER